MSFGAGYFLAAVLKIEVKFTKHSVNHLIYLFKDFFSLI